MIKQINISHMEKLEGLLEKALHEGYTHFVPIQMKFRFINQC